VLPEIEELEKTEQSAPHHLEGDVFKHTLMVLEEAPATLYGQLSALLHDVGKPSTQTKDGDKIKFLKHEEVGGEIAEAILRRLKFKSDDIKKIRVMVEQHMRPFQISDAKPGNVKKKLRQFVDVVGEELWEGIFDLAQADGVGKLPSEPGTVADLKKTLKELLHSTPPELKKPVLDGKQVMDILGIQTGPLIGKVLIFLKDATRDAWDKQNKILSEAEATKLIRDRFRSEVKALNQGNKEAAAIRVVLSYLGK